MSNGTKARKIRQARERDARAAEAARQRLSRSIKEADDRAAVADSDASRRGLRSLQRERGELTRQAQNDHRAAVGLPLIPPAERPSRGLR